MPRLEPETRRSLVVGAGIAGLAAALALASRGWEVEVAECKRVNSTVGVGLNHPANALRALRRLGVYEEVKACGYEFRGIRRFNADGQLTSQFEPVNPPDVPFQVSMTRADLHEILTGAAERAGATIRLGRTWRHLDDNGTDVGVTFNDGSQGRFDLVVGAEGIRSSLRTQLFGIGLDPVDTGYACWRVAVPRRPDVALSEYWFGGQTKATVLHLNENVMYVFLVEKGDSKTAPRREEMAGSLRAKLAGFGGLVAEARELISDSTDIHWAPLQEVFLPSPWYAGNVVLIGDSAHAVTPHLAQGAGMAMEDAIVLAEELETRDVPGALPSFMRRRFQRVKYVQDQAHAILVNEMESDPQRKAEFADSLGARQSAITEVLAAPA